MEIESLRTLRDAARDTKYWRAAAWRLERKNPEDYAPRPPGTYTDRQVFGIFTKVMIYLGDVVSLEQRETVMKRVEKMLEDLSAGVPRPVLHDALDDVRCIDDLPKDDEESDDEPPDDGEPGPSDEGGGEASGTPVERAPRKE